jgi:hypothetical protein
MADTRLLKEIESYVRDRLAQRFGQPFSTRRLVVGKRSNGYDATHEFDAVSADGSIVAAIKSSSGKTSGGKFPSGKVSAAYQELYFLSLAEAARHRILVLTDHEFHQIFKSHSDGRLAPGLELMLIPLPPELREQVQVVQEEASQEMSVSRV